MANNPAPAVFPYPFPGDHLEPRTLAALLARSVELHAERPALGEVQGQVLTYADLDAQVRGVQELLRGEKIGAGDRVAILSENKPAWGVAYFAITTMGATAVPILPDFHPNEIHHILIRSGARALIISERLHQRLEDETLRTIPTVIHLDTFTVLPALTGRDRFAEAVAEGRHRFGEMARRLGATPRPAETVPGEGDPAALIYTSGTTGFSKGVVLTHRNIVSNALGTTRIIDLNKNDRMLSILPLSHAYECTLGLVLPMMAGASVYYLDKPPVARALLPAMEAVRPTVMLAVPLVIEKIYKTRIRPQIEQRLLLRAAVRIPVVRRRVHRAAGRKLLASFGGALRSLCIGGAALSPEVERFLLEARFPYCVGYGLTETSPLIAGIEPAGQRYLSTGPPLPEMEVRLAEPDSSGVGEIQVRGPSVMGGYHEDPERTREAFTADGWFRTGDLGTQDRDGCLYIRGRLKNMILGPSGENIYPEEVEAVVNRSPLVLESLVYGREGQIWARVHLNYEELDATFSREKLGEAAQRKRVEELLENLRKDVNSRLSSFSRIARVVEQPEPFEKTPTQKIKRSLYA